MPAQFPLEIYRGDTARLSVKLWDNLHEPVDLTGCLVKAEIRDRPGGTKIVPLTCTVVLPNVIGIVLDAFDSEGLPPAGVWDMQITFPSGDVKTPLAGPVTVTPDVTDSGPHPAFHT